MNKLLAKSGVRLNNPRTLDVLLAENRLYKLSENKKNIVDKIVCARIKRLVALIAATLLKLNPIKIKFISCTVPYATSFFKSTCAHIFNDESITPIIATIKIIVWLICELYEQKIHIPYNAVLTKNPLKYIEK